jgi:hypothetical protein
MSGTWREQALIEAPVSCVWDLVGDPNRHAEWWPLVVSVEGLPEIRADATYRQVSRSPAGRGGTTFQIQALTELREIKLRCLDTGTYARWQLTEAQNQTFAEIAMGFEPGEALNPGFDALGTRVFAATLGRRYLRRWIEEALAGLRDAAREEAEREAGAASGGR